MFAMVGGLIGLAIALAVISINGLSAWWLLPAVVIGALIGDHLNVRIQLRLLAFQLKQKAAITAQLQTQPSTLLKPKQPAQPDRAPQTASLPKVNELWQSTDDAQSKPRTISPPAIPSHFDQSIALAKTWLTTGNVAAKVGVIISFFGVAFLLKYAADHHYLRMPIEFRLAGVALAAITSILFAWRIRKKNPIFSLTLQGGAIGVLYLDVFAAFRLYESIPALPAFLLLIVFTAGCGILAILQNTRALAVLGTAGGFLAPVLISTGNGSHVVLFSYYALLNAAVFAVAWFRAWRSLNLIGFVFTFAIGTSWGYHYYKPEFFSTTEPFLILFFAFYLVIAVLYSYKRSLNLKAYADATLLFGTPVVAFPLQAALVHDIQYGLAYSALVLAAIYVGIAWALLRSRQSQTLRLVCESFLVLGIAFATIAIPLGLSARWTAAAWALEGVALIWIGQRQARLLATLAGILLQFAAGISFAHQGAYPADVLPVVNGFCFGGALIAIAALFSDLYLQRNVAHFPRLNPVASLILFIWGLGWWLSIGLNEIHEHAAPEYFAAVALLFVASTTALAWALEHIETWHHGGWIAIAFLPVAWLCLLLRFLAPPVGDLFGHIGWIAWLVTVAISFWILRYKPAAMDSGIEGWWHAATLWLITALLTWQVWWYVSQAIPAGIWAEAGSATVPALLVLAIIGASHLMFWPLRDFPKHYAIWSAGFMLLFGLLLALRLIVTSAGDAEPLPYIPLLNPMDVAIGLNLLVAGFWLSTLQTWVTWPKKTLAVFWGIIAAMSFAGLTSTIMRTIHFWAGIPFTIEDLYESVLVQAALSIGWSSVALVAMIVAMRRESRTIYLIGATIIGAVVIKLFLVDLGNTGTFARVISFIGVGLFLLIIGYFAPSPPRRVS